MAYSRGYLGGTWLYFAGFEASMPYSGLKGSKSGCFWNLLRSLDRLLDRILEAPISLCCPLCLDRGGSEMEAVRGKWVISLKLCCLFSG